MGLFTAKRGPWLRIAARYVGTQREIAHQLRRIADHLTGVEEEDRPAPPGEDAPTVYTPDADFGHVEQQRQKLTQQLGREPDDDELLREIEGIEYAEGDPMILPAAKRLGRTGRVGW